MPDKVLLDGEHASPLAARLGAGGAHNMDGAARSYSSTSGYNGMGGGAAQFSSSNSMGMGAGKVQTGVDAHGNPTYFERINKLSERLQGLQVGLQHERNSRYDQLCSRLKTVDERVTGAQEANGKK